MSQRELDQVFERLYRGEKINGWEHEDLSSLQGLISVDAAWARYVADDGRAGAWVLLPQPPLKTELNV